MSRFEVFPCFLPRASCVQIVSAHVRQAAFKSLCRTVNVQGPWPNRSKWSKSLSQRALSKKSNGYFVCPRIWPRWPCMRNGEVTQEAEEWRASHAVILREAGFGFVRFCFASSDDHRSREKHSLVSRSRRFLFPHDYYHASERRCLCVVKESFAPTFSASCAAVIAFSQMQKTTRPLHSSRPLEFAHQTVGHRLNLKALHPWVGLSGGSIF